MSCRFDGCNFPEDPETGVCGFHADLIRIMRTNIEMAKHQPRPKRIPKCRRCGAKMLAFSFRVGCWNFNCPNGCEYCGECRRYIDYRTKCPHGIPKKREPEEPEYVM